MSANEQSKRRLLSRLPAAFIAAVLGLGAAVDDVLRATVYLTDLSVFPRVNAIYEKHLGREPLPARSTVGVAALPMGAAVEIDLIAHVP